MVLASVFVLSGCEKTASQVETETMNQIWDQNLETIKEYTENNIAKAIAEYGYDGILELKREYRIIYGRLFDNSLLKRLEDFENAHGVVVRAEVDEVMRSGEEYTSRTILTGENGEQEALTVTFTKDGLPYNATMQAYSDDTKLTMGQKMATAGSNTITGLLVVFAVLILLSLIIYCFKFIGLVTAPPKKAETESEAAPSKANVSAAPAASAATDDGALVAVIAAAVSAASGMPTDGFVVRSIKRSQKNRWK